MKYLFLQAPKCKSLGIKNLLLLFLLHFPLESTIAAATTEDVHNIVDICVNLHRIQKDYILVGMEVRYLSPKENLKSTLEKVNDEFSQLKSDHHLNENIERQLSSIMEGWKKVQSLASSSPSQNKIKELHILIENLTDLCLKTADNIERDTHIDGEKYVVESAEMGMEVQRLAALYLMRAWDIEDKNYFSEAEHTLEEFEKFFHELQSADERYVTKEIKEEIKSIEKDFVVFQQMAISKSGRFVPSLAQRSAEKLFSSINNVTQLIIERVEK